MRAVTGIPFILSRQDRRRVGLVGPRPVPCDHGLALRRSCHQPRTRLRSAGGLVGTCAAGRK